MESECFFPVEISQEFSQIFALSNAEEIMTDLTSMAKNFLLAAVEYSLEHLCNSILKCLRFPITTHSISVFLKILDVPHIYPDLVLPLPPVVKSEVQSVAKLLQKANLVRELKKEEKISIEMLQMVLKLIDNKSVPRFFLSN